MNKQGEQGIEYVDLTSNPTGGCEHECRWQMPDGSTAICYAESIAHGLARKAYPHGFKHHYWRPEELKAPLKLKEPSRIFLGSMADLFGHWVPEAQIHAVLDMCREADWHTFLVLTKNAPRLLKFHFPANVHVGVSMPPTFMHGKRLTGQQQRIMMGRTLDVLAKLDLVSVRWISFEPLSFEVAPMLHKHGTPLEWAVIGAASNGKTTYQPDPWHVHQLLNHLDEAGVPIFFKGNLKWSPWRAEYP